MKDLNKEHTLKKLRVWKGLTQDQIAKDLKLTIGQYRSYESNKTTPKYKMRDKIARYFNKNMSDIWEHINSEVK